MSLRERFLDRCVEPLLELLADGPFGDFYAEIMLPPVFWGTIIVQGLWSLFWRHLLVAAAVGGGLWWLWRWSA